MFLRWKIRRVLEVERESSMGLLGRVGELMVYETLMDMPAVVF